MRRGLRKIELEPQQPQRRRQWRDARKRARIQAQRAIEAVRLMGIVVVGVPGGLGLSAAVFHVPAVVRGIGGSGSGSGQPEHLPERCRPICEDVSGERRRGGAEKHRQQREPGNRTKSNHSCCSILIRDQGTLLSTCHTPATYESMQQNGGECAGSSHPGSRAHVLTAEGRCSPSARA
jgi:hypothetical protein